MLNHPSLKVSVRTGTEGPRHDPYSFREVTVIQPDGTTVLHEGLGTWLLSNGRKVRPPKDCDAAQWCRSTAFVTLTGYSIAQLERIERKLKSRCRSCGGRSFHSESGYPGEHFEVCDDCGNVHDTFFNIREVE